MNKKTALFTIIMVIAGMLVACEADFTTEKRVTWWWKDGLTKEDTQWLSSRRALPSAISIKDRLTCTIPDTLGEGIGFGRRKKGGANRKI